MGVLGSDKEIPFCFLPGSVDQTLQPSVTAWVSLPAACDNHQLSQLMSACERPDAHDSSLQTQTHYGSRPLEQTHTLAHRMLMICRLLWMSWRMELFTGACSAWVIVFKHCAWGSAALNLQHIEESSNANVLSAVWSWAAPAQVGMQCDVICL